MPSRTAGPGTGDSGGGETAAHPLRAEGRGGDAVVAAEGLGELRRLAVADPPGDVADGQRAGRQEVGGAVHAHAGEMLAERRVPDLAVGALELAPRGRHAPRDVVEGEIGAVFLRDDRGGVVEEAGAELDRLISLHSSVATSPNTGMDDDERAGRPNMARQRSWAA